MSTSNRIAVLALLACIGGCSDDPVKNGDVDAGNPVADGGLPSAVAGATYRAGQTTVLGQEPRAVLVANLNGDNNKDLVVVNQFSADVQFLLGDGNGGFTESGDSIDRAVAAVAADFDQDGVDDLALSVDGEARIEVILDPAGVPFRLSFAVSDLPDGLAAADFDGDGDIDISASIAGNLSDPATSIATFFWEENTFLSPSITSVGFQPRALTTVGTDLVVLLGTTSALLLENDGTGAFAASAPFGVGEGVLEMTVVDIDQTGTPDLVSADLSASVLTATLDMPNSDAAMLAEVSTPFGVITANINDDGVPDIVATSIDEERVVALVSKEDGTYGMREVAALEGAVRLGNLAAADFDNDGTDDFAVIERGRDSAGTLHILLSSELPTR